MTAASLAVRLSTTYAKKARARNLHDALKAELEFDALPTKRESKREIQQDR